MNTLSKKQQHRIARDSADVWQKIKHCIWCFQYRDGEIPK